MNIEKNDFQRPVFDLDPNKDVEGNKNFLSHIKPLTHSTFFDSNVFIKRPHRKKNLHSISVVHKEYQEYGKIGWAMTNLIQERRAL
ncbi:hypothetical protein GcM3_219006 [Golovinomyces cichoracearum]|uniref:Uncharacterized protein n=1 Tax=Golovinomyces cichoracearum TaxID=62708 RepID=A0A420H7D1_9PEZI|nr:hypothetical protein GcM3_219006 [Golovinomyces cichoracearum]